MRPARLRMKIGLLLSGIAATSCQTTQDHYVRGQLLRVSESLSEAGGSEDDARGGATPRISGDGRTVVFYSDAYFNGVTPSEDNDYHIWKADVSSTRSPPFPKRNVYNHATHDSKGPAVNEDGTKVVFGSDDKIMLWTADDASIGMTPRELATDAYDGTGDVDISADGNWVVYEKKSVYNVELISTQTGANATVINEVADSGERASDAAISGHGEYVAFVTNMPSSAKHEVWVYDRVNDARHKVTDVANLGACSDKPAIMAKLEAYWGELAACHRLAAPPPAIALLSSHGWQRSDTRPLHFVCRHEQRSRLPRLQLYKGGNHDGLGVLLQVPCGSGSERVH